MRAWSELSAEVPTPGKTVDKLTFVFPAIHHHAVLQVQLCRTLRVPNDGKNHAAPTGFEAFPMMTTGMEDVQHQLPLYPSDALWLNFVSSSGFPFAVRVDFDQRCAVTGIPFQEELTQGIRRTKDRNENLQNFLVIPEQKTLDGYSVGGEQFAQFVLEQQDKPKLMTIWVYPLKKDLYQKMLFGNGMHNGRLSEATRWGQYHEFEDMTGESKMGVGLVNQTIEPNLRPVEDWDLEAGQSVTVELVSMLEWLSSKDNKPLHHPYTQAIYQKLGYPWGESYTEVKPIVPFEDKENGLDEAFFPKVEEEMKPMVGAEQVSDEDVLIEPIVVEVKPEIEVEEQNQETVDNSAEPKAPIGWWREPEKPIQTINELPKSKGAKQINGGYSFDATSDYSSSWQGSSQVTRIEFVHQARTQKKKESEKSFWKKLFFGLRLNET